MCPLLDASRTSLGILLDEGNERVKLEAGMVSSQGQEVIGWQESMFYLSLSRTNREVFEAGDSRSKV